MTQTLPKGITQRGKKYRVSIMVDGVRKTATTDTLQDALKVADKFRTGTAADGTPDYKPWTLAEAFANYATQHLAPSGRKQTSIETYEARGRMFCRYFGDDKSVDAIDTAAVYQFVETIRRESGYAPATLSMNVVILKSVLRHARRMKGMIAELPEMPKIKVPRRQARFVTHEEEDDLIAYFEDEKKDLCRDAIICLVDLGLRVDCELLSSRWRDINLDQRKVHVWNSKSAEPRTIPMTRRVAATLKRLKMVRGSLPGPFSGLHYKQMAAEWNKARKALGRADDPNFTLHILRHTFCTRLVSNGVDLRMVQQLAGHQDINTTMRYAHFIPERMASAIDTLERDREELRIAS